MNDELFRPRGLYCLIMSYDVKSRSNVVRPGQSDSPSHVIRQGISQGTNSSRMRSNDGILGASNFPAAAQLVYADPKHALGNNVEENSGEERAKPGAWGHGRTKVQSVLTAHADKEDLKSQAKFVSFFCVGISLMSCAVCGRVVRSASGAECVAAKEEPDEPDQLPYGPECGTQREGPAETREA